MVGGFVSIFENKNLSLSTRNLDSVYGDLNHVLDLIEKSDDLEELLSLYIYIINFKTEIRNEKFLSSIRDRIIYLADNKSEKWSEIDQHNRRYIAKSQKLMEEGLDASIYKNQKRMVEDFLNKYDIPSRPYTPLTDYELFFVLKKFYMSTDDYLSLSILYSLIGDKNIIEFHRNGTLGEAVFSNYSFNQYLKINRHHNFLDLITIVHEIGHIKYYFLSLKDKNPVDVNDFYYVKQFVEAYPRYQERALCDYLISEGIFKSDIKTYLLRELFSYNMYLDDFIKEPNLTDFRVINGRIGGDLLNKVMVDKKTISESSDSYMYNDTFSKNEMEKSVLSTVDVIKKI